MNFNKYKNIFFTADVHFGHANIIKWCPDTRPWATTQEMEDGIVVHWNTYVGPDDLVFIIGDFAFMNQEQTVRILRRLNGDKVLVIGNHDHKNMKFPAFRDEFVMCKDLVDVYLPVPGGGLNDTHKVVMFHYPIYEWNQMHRGAFHLYGHVHGKSIPIPGRLMDVGWDAHGKLLSWKEVYNKLIQIEIREH